MKRVALVAVAGVLLAGCASATDGGETPAEDETSPATESTPGATEGQPEPQAPDLPATAVTGVLEFSYSSADGAEFDPAVMGVDAGDVTGRWYQADGFFVVVYDGLDLAATGPLCPGNSIQLPSGEFQYVSNAPTEGADCSTFPTLTTDPDVGALECAGVLAYRTAIPADAEGGLYGTLERPVDGGVMGLTGIAAASADVPEVDLGSLGC